MGPHANTGCSYDEQRVASSTASPLIPRTLIMDSPDIQNTKSNGKNELTVILTIKSVQLLMISFLA